jgi:hypothetical protein
MHLVLQRNSWFVATQSYSDCFQDTEHITQEGLLNSAKSIYLEQKALTQSPGGRVFLEALI